MSWWDVHAYAKPNFKTCDAVLRLPGRAMLPAVVHQLDRNKTNWKKMVKCWAQANHHQRQLKGVSAALTWADNEWVKPEHQPDAVRKGLVNGM